jgi:putative membrane protein
MNRTTNNYRSAFAGFLIATGFLMAACDNNPSTGASKDSTEVATEENDAKFDDKKLEKDAQFLVDAASFHLDQIKLGGMAQRLSRDTAVQQLGEKMLKEHAEFLKEAANLAGSKQISIPDSASRAAAESYSGLSGKNATEFDKGYFDLLIKDHEKAIAVFEKEAADSRDQELKAWATTTLPKLRKHLDHVFDSQKKTAKP